MQSTRLLPLQFLCPAWTPRELVQLAQRRGFRATGRNAARSTETGQNASRDTGTTRGKGQERKKGLKDTRRPVPTLFDELFPADSHVKKKQSKRHLDRLPAFQWKGDIPTRAPMRRVDWAGSSSAASDTGYLKGLRNEAAFQKSEQRLPQVPAVLLVSGLSKNLEASDFFRLSSKGEHIEGWSRGLMKVIQARDSSTLAPLSHYFLIFTSPNAANKYRKSLQRLHALSKMTSFIKQSSMPLPPDLAPEDGEDIDKQLNSFTLRSPANPISVRFIMRPWSQFVQKMVEHGMHAAVKEQQGKGDALVLLGISDGRHSVMDISEAIRNHGKQRNLPWRLAGGERDVEKLNDPMTAGGDKFDEANGLQEGKRKQLDARGKENRFVIAFQDMHEARRFVREWHRLPLPASSSRHSHPLVNAQMMW